MSDLTPERKRELANKAFEQLLIYCYMIFDARRACIDPMDFQVLCAEISWLYEDVDHPRKSLITMEDIQARRFTQLRGKFSEDIIARAQIQFPWSQNAPRIFHRKYVTGIGTRTPPNDIVPYQLALGRAMCDDGFTWRSGDADGSDKNFIAGAMQSKCWEECKAEVFLHKQVVRYPDGFVREADGEVYFDASQFDNWPEARGLAFEARGSFEGLYDGGIALHSRNPYQVLGFDLNTPSNAVFCYAEPVGRKGQVKGGTNTAVQIALKRGIEVINLATEAGLARVNAYLARKGLTP